MPLVRNAYKCSRCGSMMENEERTMARTTLIGDVVTAQFTEDLCPPCATGAVAGQQTKGVRRQGKGVVHILPEAKSDAA